MMRSARLAVVLLVLAAIPSRARAQDGWSLDVVPRAGMISPDEYFYELFTNFAGDGPVEWTNGSLGRAFVAGVGLELGLGSEGFLLRAEVLRSFDMWLLATHGIVRPRVFFEAPEIVNTFLDVPGSITFTSVQVVLPLRVQPWRLKPYVLLGVGGKRYGFGESTRPNEVNAVLPSPGFTWGGDLGGGVSLRLFGLEGDIQLRDAISWYWDKPQHDLLITGGVQWRVR